MAGGQVGMRTIGNGEFVRFSCAFALAVVAAIGIGVLGGTVFVRANTQYMTMPALGRMPVMCAAAKGRMNQHGKCHEMSK